MRTHNIIISSTDRDRLLDLIDSARLDWRIPRNSLDVLEGELARARIVDPLELPRDVVAIGSTVWFQDLDTQENERLQLVLPPDADVTCRRVSVLSPTGHGASRISPRRLCGVAASPRSPPAGNP